jgi:SAM-dependent methyltransferase
MGKNTRRIINLWLFLPLIILLSYLFLNKSSKALPENEEYVTIAILAKDKAHVLPLYLDCIEKQTWPKEKTHLYIRTNDNSDETDSLLQNWVKEVGHSYAKIYYDDSSVNEELKAFREHEWNATRFQILGAIRQESVDWARSHNSHYFVADCDNFIHPETVENLVETALPIVAPFLKTIGPSFYSNFHADIDANGYFAQSKLYQDVFGQVVKGLIEVPVVHCTYLIRHNMLDKIQYNDGSDRYEYVIFSDNARRKSIPQYLDNRKVYGRVTFAESAEEFEKEYLSSEFCDDERRIANVFAKIYHKGIWAKDKEGRGTSGEGSTEQNTVEYRGFLQNFMQEHKIQSVVDAGCGDWEFSQKLDWKGIDYVGYDIVQSVIEGNQKKFTQPHVKFIHQNFLEEELPTADLFISKDVFQHLPTDALLSFLPKLKNYKYCLICNDQDFQAEGPNRDTEIGGYRPLDLTKAPFHLNAEKVLTFSSGRVTKTVWLIDNSLSSGD